jgi:glycosyltransferase involved in cell wall biosynthesis
MRDRRIAILGTRGIPACYGGFETFAEEIATRLVERGHDVTVLCEKRKGERPSVYKGVNLRYVSAPSFGPLTTIVFDLLCLVKARRSYEVVYMLGYGASLFCFIPRLWGAEVWINMDGIEWRRSKWSRAAKLYLRLMEGMALWTANRIIADAEGVRGHLAGRHRWLPPCTVIPYGSPVIECAPDAALIAEWDLHVDQYYIVVCRLEPENHVFEVVRGFAAANPYYPLIVVGDHLEKKRYVQQLVAMRDERIRFIGTVYDRDKLQALRYHARAYFHGHSVGGTNPSLLEAMGCGNAIVAHDNMFNREVAGDEAMYFSASEDLPKLIRALESDEERRGVMREAARKRVASRYSWEQVCDRYIELLEGRRTGLSEGNTPATAHALRSTK